jgi:hypothetical protein
MNKVIVKIKVIENCSKCDFMRNSWRHRKTICTKINKVLETWDIKFAENIEIPEWCPLEDHNPKFVDVCQ